MRLTSAFARFWRLATLAVLAMASLSLAFGDAAACDTPVYRYATYNWTPSPYRIYYIARGEKLSVDDPIRLAVSELTTVAEGQPHAVANLELIEIDAAAESPLEPLPPALRDEAGFILERATTADDGGETPTLPRFAVVLPNGYPVYEGPLTAADVRAIADSPARRRLVELLAGGKATVLLLLEGAKAEDSAAAEKLIEATIARAAAGELSPLPDPALSTTPPDAKPAQVDVAMLRMRRDDPAEKWFVMSLLHLEPEIDERTEPMVFSVYARGRVNPPAIGTGISADELERQVRFVLGPCACTVKHDNPGMDLALVADWDAIAMAMAKKFGSETGNERLLGEVPGLFPEIVDVDTGSTTPSAAATSDAATNAAAEATRSDPTVGEKQAAASPPAPANEANSGPDGFRTGMSLDEATRRESSDSTLLWNVGIGVVVAMILLGAASIALFRRPA